MTDGLPGWLQQLADVAPTVTGEQLSRYLPPEHGGRESAVLVLFGEGPYGPDVLLIERAANLRSHAGQPAFPGGARDPGDESATAAALREAVEETGLDPSGVEVIAELPALFLPPSGFVVVPVLAWWSKPSVVGPVDPAECAAVARIPVADLVDPANRLRVKAASGYVGSAFTVGGMLVWGFTAGLLDRLLDLAGWALPWEPETVHEIDRYGTLR